METNRRYVKYNVTSMFWATSIPSGWNEIKIKHLFLERSEKGFPDELLLSATQSRGVIPTSSYETRTVVATKGFDTLKLVEVGDFVISLRSFQGGIEYSEYRGIISPAYTVMTPKELINKGYFKYLAKSDAFIDLLKTCVTGIREGQNINYSMLRKAYIPLPPLEEQHQIERFLDSKISKINKFIKAKKREKELLKEKIEFLCFNEITNSLKLDSWNNSFDDSWKKVKAKRIFEEVNVKNKPSEELLAVTQDNGVIFKKDCTKNYVSPSGSLDSLKLVQNGDYVISLRSFQGGIEYSYIRGIVSPAYNVFRLKPKYNNPHLRTYFKHLFKTKAFIELLRTLGGGIRDGKNISFSEISEYYMPLPSDVHLKAIEQLSKQYDTLNQQQIKLFDLMKEYKASLINNVTIGKVDVRNILIDVSFESEGLENMDVEVEEEQPIDEQ